jgi:phosphoglucosamine mutase
VECYIDGNLSPLGIEGDIPFATGEKIGQIVDYVAGRNRYVAYLISLASHSYKHLRIGIDCANGASWSISSAVFGALGARVSLIGAEPDGLNINVACGSTHIEALQKLVRDQHLDVGFAFDGDCDRCIAVDERGRVVDGDGILYILAGRLKARGMLGGNTVVSTVMSNGGLARSLKDIGIASVETAVGDRFVFEEMQKGDLTLGGEQSGHIIIRKYATSGDGLLTAIMLCEEMCDRKRPISELCKGLRIYPQITKNLKVRDQNAVMSDEAVKQALCEIEALLSGRGRVILRKSGTEPVVRIMVECESEEDCLDYAERIARAIEERGHLAL